MITPRDRRGGRLQVFAEGRDGLMSDRVRQEQMKKNYRSRTGNATATACYPLKPTVVGPSISLGFLP
jgi:hypothetical protein